MLRDLTTVLVLALAGGVALSACNGSQCFDCCGGTDCGCGVGCVSECAVTGSGGATSCNGFGGNTPVPCAKGQTMACSSIPSSAPVPSCGEGQQTCDGKGFGVCDDEVPHPDACVQPSSWTCIGDPPPCGAPVWATSLAGTGAETARSVVVDPTGNAVVAGTSAGGTMQIGGSSVVLPKQGAFVAKLDANGAPLWGLGIDGALAAAVAVDDTGAVYVTGSFVQSLKVGDVHVTGKGNGPLAYLVKLSPGGQVVWAVEAFHGASLVPAAIGVWDGHPIVAGSYVAGATVVFEGLDLPRTLGGGDGFVAGLSPATGKTQWVARVGTNDGDDVLRALAFDGLGNVVVAGSSVPAPRFHCLVPRMFVAGVTIGKRRASWSFVNDASPFDVHAVAASGSSVVLAAQVGGPFIGGNGAATDAPGVLVSMAVSMLAAGASIQWTIPLSGVGEAVALDSSGTATLGGAIGARAFVSRYDSTGERFYQHVYTPAPLSAGAPARVAVHGLALAPDEGAVVVGGVEGSAELALGFGSEPVTSTVDLDAFVAHLAP